MPIPLTERGLGPSGYSRDFCYNENDKSLSRKSSALRHSEQSSATKKRSVEKKSLYDELSCLDGLKRDRDLDYEEYEKIQSKINTPLNFELQEVSSEKLILQPASARNSSDYHARDFAALRDSITRQR